MGVFGDRLPAAVDDIADQAAIPLAAVVCAWLYLRVKRRVTSLEVEVPG